MRASLVILRVPFVVALLTVAASVLLLSVPASGQKAISIAAQVANPVNSQTSRLGLPGLGEIKGFVYATVAKADDAQGLAVRGEPSLSGQAMAYLALGTEIKGSSAYRDGWIRVEGQQFHGWVSLANLKALGGQAEVVAVDRPENCLRIRSGPASSYQVIACARVDEKLQLSGFWGENDWAELASRGWIFGPQISAEFKPPRTAVAGSRISSGSSSQPVESGPQVYTGSSYDYSYNPYYSYLDSYWYWPRYRRHFYYRDHSLHSGYSVRAYGRAGARHTR